MPQMTVNVTVTPPSGGGGTQYNQITEIISDNNSDTAPSVAAAIDGTLTTRTDANTGVITCASGHGVTTSDKLDVYWSGGARYGVTVTAQTGTTISIDAGSGTDLPAATTVLTFKEPQEENPEVDGDTVVGIYARAEVASMIKVNQADGTPIINIPLDAEGIYIWFDDSSVDNPVYGDNPLAGVSVGEVLLSHADSTQARPVVINFLYN